MKPRQLEYLTKSLGPGRSRRLHRAASSLGAHRDGLWQSQEWQGHGKQWQHSERGETLRYEGGGPPKSRIAC